MRVEIDHIITFIKVVEFNSFTAAAEALKVSKSVVSKHVTALEEALGLRLLKRSTRKLNLTDVGNTYYQQVKTIPGQVYSAQLSLQPYLNEPKGLLKVISPANFADSLKMDVIPNFMLKHPGVTLKLEFVRPVEDYVNDDFDVIIMWKLNNTDFPDYNLIPIKLFSMPVGIYASPLYLEKQGVPKSPRDIVNFNCFSSGGRKWPFLESDGPMYYVHTHGNLETTNDDVITEATIKGAGIAYSYPFLFEEALRNQQVVPLLKDYTNFFLEVYAFYHPSPFVPLKIRDFINGMKLHYKTIQTKILQRGDS